MQHRSINDRPTDATPRRAAEEKYRRAGPPGRPPGCSSDSEDVRRQTAGNAPVKSRGSSHVTNHHHHRAPRIVFMHPAAESANSVSLAVSARSLPHPTTATLVSVLSE